MPQQSAATRDREARDSRTPRAEAAARALELAPGREDGLTSVEILESKLRIPPVGPGIASRTGIVNRLRAKRSPRLATIVAPAGYGKTTVLAQWAARDERPFVWLSIDEHDNDPHILLRHLAAALDRVEQLDAAAGEDRSTDSLWRVAAPRLANRFAATTRPLVAVLDDADLLRRGDAADILALLADNVPEGSMLVLTGRTAPRVGMARRRAGRRLLELGAADLALSTREAQLLLRGAGVELEAGEIAELCDRTEGWPAGLYLVAAALAGGNALGTPSALDTGERHVAEYLDSEHLSGLSADRLRFLRRSSVLDRLSGPLCDAVTESNDSTEELRAIARANLFLVPVDGERGWYRYHRLFRETLRRQLEDSEPDLVPQLHRSAADWLERRGELEAALDHVQECRDHGRAARILTAIALPAYHAGRGAAVESWLGRFGADAPLARYPAVAALGAWIYALRGRAPEAEAWLESARARKADKLVPATTALLRVAMGAGTAAGYPKRIEAAVAALPADSPWLAMALLLRGSAASMRGDNAAAGASFDAAAAEAERAGSGDTILAAAGLRALAAGAAGDHETAERLVLESRALPTAGPVEKYPLAAIAHAAAARVLLRRGRWDDVRHEILEAEPLAEQLGDALPWLAVDTRLALGASYVALRDRGGAQAQLAALDELLARHVTLDGFRAQVAGLQAQLDELPETRDGRSSALTAAELRLLPLLATHLSFREIGDRLFVSRNTIKTQAISAYRKLGVSSRSAAIERAGELGLVGDATAAPEGVHPTGVM